MVKISHVAVFALILISLISPVCAQNIAALWNGQTSANINLGTVLPDGTTHSWPAGRGYGLEVQRVAPNPNSPANLYVRASGDFSDGNGHTISLSNFRYSNYGGSVSSPRQFETTYRLVRSNWTRNQREYLPVDLYLTIPIGTNPGAYTLTIYHLVVDSNAPQPVSSSSGVAGDVSYNITENTVNTTGSPTNTYNNLTDDVTSTFILMKLFDQGL